ncbi:MAG: NUDIX hydrolase [Candidatus Aenigmarchaeota archaeon]|nr:NUDIX hydrolase [Candidatus Aenigmarchaeota archaeon]
MKRVTLTVDAIIEIDGKIVLIRRGANPFRGMWAIPGGHVNYRETVEHAAVREAFEETGLKIKLTKLVGVYSDPKRNPDKEHRVAVAFAAKKTGGRLSSGDDAAAVMLIPISELPETRLAFDHDKIIRDYMSQRVTK